MGYESIFSRTPAVEQLHRTLDNGASKAGSDISIDCPVLLASFIVLFVAR